MEFLSGAKPIVVVRVHCKDSAPLLQVGLTNNRLCLFFNSLQCRQQYRHQQHNNGNHHQKLYQGKSFSLAHGGSPSFFEGFSKLTIFAKDDGSRWYPYLP